MMLSRYPKIIKCGWDTRLSLPELIKELCPKPDVSYALVTGKSARNQLIKQECEAILGNAKIYYNNITPDPRLSDVDGLVELLRQTPVDCVIAIGGGSVIDVAKVAAAIAPDQGNCQAYFYGERQITRKGITFIALPTTAGAGAEITKNSVLIDQETSIKQSIRHLTMIPDAAICDAALTVTMPPGVTAASGLDALTQAIESYLNANANELSKALVLRSVPLIMSSIEIACQEGDNRTARTKMMDGSLLSAMSFSQVGLGAVHGLAHPLGSLLDIKHGYTCAVLLPHILRYNKPVSGEALNELAAAVNLKNGDALLDEIERLSDQLGIPKSFKQDGLNESHFDFIVKHCRSNSMRGNPREMPDDIVYEFLNQLASD